MVPKAYVGETNNYEKKKK